MIVSLPQAEHCDSPICHGEGDRIGRCIVPWPVIRTTRRRHAYASPRNNMSDRLSENIISLLSEPILARILSRLRATIFSTMI